MLTVRFFLFWYVLLLNGCRAGLPQSVTIKEASGVIRLNDDLLVVDDSATGAYFRIPLHGSRGPMIPLNHPDIQYVALSRASLATDLEGIDRLADGRLVLLSERLRSLVGEDGVIAEYDKSLAEFAERGLEGVCIRALPDGSSRVAVVWEGGYPERSSLPLPLQNQRDWMAMQPVVLVHDLKPGAKGMTIRISDAVNCIRLDVPTPAGQEPQAQRFRAPDLVWYRSRSWESDEWGFLVLISSENFVETPQYLYHWLQRFDIQGRRFGEPLDLSRYVPAEIQGSNWEGMGWFEKGRSVVLVHEGEPNLAPNAFILQLPTEWQFSLDE
jgi:hypothetical protein